MGKAGLVVPILALAALLALGPIITGISWAGAPSIPSSLGVALAYADTEGRAPNSGTCDTCFPNPWCGSPGVQFIGSSTNYNGNSTDPVNCKSGGWDTAAVLVTNNGSTPITLTNLTVVLPLPASGNPGSPFCPQPPRPITFELWFGQQYYFGDKSKLAYYGGPISIPAGGQAIFTGTSSDGSYTCPTGNYPSSPPKATYDFDTSDANFLSGCTPTNDTVSDPRITFTANGFAPTLYIDKGHVLDVGGIDPGNCDPTKADPQWGHENLGWRPADSACGEFCPMNQPLAMASTSTAIGSTTSAPGGASTTLEYGIVAVVVIVLVAIGYAARRGRTTAA